MSATLPGTLENPPFYSLLKSEKSPQHSCLLFVYILPKYIDNLLV